MSERQTDRAVAAFAESRPRLEAVTSTFVELITGMLDEAGFNYLSVTGRTKSVGSFAAKAHRERDGRLVHPDPLSQITDQVGVRVITYVHSDVVAIAQLFTDSDQIAVLEDRDMGRDTARQGRFGYASRHLLLSLSGTGAAASYDPMRCVSVQLRTVLQHAWAEFEHDIRYKGSVPEVDVPDLDRRFALAAGLLELADNEFSAIRDRLRSTTPTERPPESSETADPRIPTPVLATYLGNRFPDAGWSRTEHYAWVSGLLLDLGIDSLDALDALLAGVDTDAINTAMGYRFPAGAVRRLDDVLLAVFGTRYAGLADNAHRITLLENRLAKLDPVRRPDAGDR